MNNDVLGVVMRLAHDMRERALVLLQISNESVEFKEHAAYVAELWLTLAALEDRFRHPGYQAEQLASVEGKSP